MNYSLPKAVTIDGTEYKIRYDFRVILKIIEMLNDRDLTDAEKAECLLIMFYEEPQKITDMAAAVKECFSFIDGGENKTREKRPRLIDWEQDFEYIVAPVNRVIGRDIREEAPLHWWTFLSAYMEIGPDCLFSQIVAIRDKQKRGKKLDKAEREWFNRNRSIVTLRQRYSDSEANAIKQWTGGD